MSGVLLGLGGLSMGLSSLYFDQGTEWAGIAWAVIGVLWVIAAVRDWWADR